MLDGKEITWIIDNITGELTVEGLTKRELAEIAGDVLPEGAHLNCARPSGVPPLESMASIVVQDPDESLQIFRIYHGSVVEGLGRRSVVQTSGCPIRCAFFIYSLKWAKYDATHDSTEQRTFFANPRCRDVAQPFSC